MATAAQIEANRRNARMSTGPKSAAGKARASLNSMKHGRRAKAVVPVLPQEDPAELVAKIRQWVEDLRPYDAAERDLVVRAARLSWTLDRLERCETAGLAVRVRQAQLPSDVETVEKVCDLGRKLLYNAGPRILPVSGPPWDDNPAAFLCGLESTAEGCRWLLERWTVLGDMLERGAIWTLTDLYRSIRLQGKHPVDAVNDPELNLQIQAWEMVSPGAAVDFWERCYHQTPKVDPGFQGFMEWREIADRPADEEEAMGLIKRMIAGRIERLGELIALHEEIAGEEAIERADAASFDPGPEAERLRRSQAARVAGAEADAGAVPEDAGGEGEAEDLHHGGHGGKRTTGSGIANEADSGGRTGSGKAEQGTAEEDLESTTEGTENTEGKEGGGPRDEAGGGSREGGIGGRAGEGRTIPGRKRHHGAGSGGRFGEGA